MKLKRKRPQINVRIEVMPGSEIRIHDPKRNEYHSIYYVKMFWNTREECHWYDLVVNRGTKLYKKLMKRKKFPNMVFMARSSGENFPMRIGRAAPIRRSHHLSYNQWPVSFVISVTWEKISPLDMIELLDRN